MNTNTLHPTPHTLNPTQQREHQVWELRVQCYSQFDIAQEALAAWKQSKSPTKSPEAPPASPNPNSEEQRSDQNPVPSQNPAKSDSDQPEADPPDYRQDVPPGIGWGVLCGAAKRGQAEELGGRAGVPTKPKEGKSAFLRIAIQALAAVRAIRATFQPEQNPCDDNVKMIVGIDLDHMKYKNGDPVQRAEVDRLIALNNAR